VILRYALEQARAQVEAAENYRQLRKVKGVEFFFFFVEWGWICRFVYFDFSPLG
jgi:hypothetical protein